MVFANMGEDSDTGMSPQTRHATELNASPGAAIGDCVFDDDEDAVIMHNEGKKVTSSSVRRLILRTSTGFFISEGILTSRGGKTSHAAVVARCSLLVARGMASLAWR